MNTQFFRHTIYRLQNAIFDLRRYLPGPVRQALKPLYRRWWRKVSQKNLSAALSTTVPAGLPPTGYAVLCFPPLDWELRIQRPQQLLLRLARAGHPGYYLRTDFAPGHSPARSANHVDSGRLKLLIGNHRPLQSRGKCLRAAPFPAHCRVRLRQSLVVWSQPSSR